MPATAAWLASAEALLNRCIDSSARAAALARRLEGTALQVDIEGFTRIRSVRHRRPAGAAARAERLRGGHADASFQDRRRRFCNCSRAGESAGRPATSGRRRKFAATRRSPTGIESYSRLARPDPEEELSRWIGDLAGAARIAIRTSARSSAHAARGAPPARTSPNICRRKAATSSTGPSSTSSCAASTRCGRPPTGSRPGSGTSSDACKGAA